MQPYQALRERLDRGETVVLDGPTGSELVRRGVRWRSLGLRFDAPTVQAVHQEYLSAGADVLRTNTFQLNRRIYQDVFRDAAHMRHIGAPDLDRRVPELVPRAVQIAQAARAAEGKETVPIAGVMSPRKAWSCAFRMWACARSIGVSWATRFGDASVSATSVCADATIRARA